MECLLARPEWFTSDAAAGIGALLIIVAVLLSIPDWRVPPEWKDPWQ